MDQFLSELGQFRRRWQQGLLRCVLFELAGWAALTLASLCWLDYFFAFEPIARIIIGGTCLAALLAWAMVRLIRIFRIDLRDSAVYADTLLKSTRREILSALEIGPPQAEKSALSAYLAHKGIAAARIRLTELTQVRLNRLPAAVRKRFILALGVSILPALLNIGAASVLIRRYLLPTADIAPYSPYVFHITPDSPEVLYGAEQVIQVSISGAAIHQPVRFATREAGHILESPCFQAGPQDYVQRLERVMQPLEFCFLVGKARSSWHRVNILYQPHVVSAHFRLIPPSYARQGEKHFELGAEALRGLKGTRVEMTIRSNRPLKSGELTIVPTEERAHSETVYGSLSEGNQLTYRWEFSSPARLSMMMYDILGTPAREPLNIRQDIVADERPVVTLVEPQAFSLATPGIKVPVAASVEDDIGLRRCDLFRALKGYRSRAVPVDIEPWATTREITYELDLAGLGVQPGQVIELFVEASDTNPDLTGSNASDIARIKIISDEAYAEMVRARTTIADFERRFQGIADQYGALIQSLDETESALQKGRLSPEKAAERMKTLHARLQGVAETVQGIAADYAAFDLEKRLSKSAADMTAKLEQAGSHKGWTSADPNDQLAAVVRAINHLKGLEAQSRALEEDAGEVAAVSRVMAMGAWYRSLLDRQIVHVSRLGQYAAGDRKGFTPGPLAESQAAIRGDLNELMQKLEFNARQLPAGYEGLRASTLEFIQKLKALNIPSPMHAGEKACLDEQPRQAWNYAGEALEKMQEVLRACKSKGFAQTCSGGINFKVPDPLARTMAQMLDSLMSQYRQGVGWGSGTGAAGVGIAGAWQGSYLNGYTAFNVPVYGPERKNPFSSEATTKHAEGHGPAGERGVGRAVSYQETIRDTEKFGTGGAGFPMDAVPARYREAVKSFYSGSHASGEQP